MHMWGEWVVHAHVGGVGGPCTCGGSGWSMHMWGEWVIHALTGGPSAPGGPGVPSRPAGPWDEMRIQFKSRKFTYVCVCVRVCV